MAASFRNRYHRRPDSLATVAACTKGTGDGDTLVINRLTASCLRRAETPTGMAGGCFRDLYRDIHTAIVADDRAGIEENLRAPVSSDRRNGFEFTARAFRQGGQRSESRHDPVLTPNALPCFAEMIGARRLEHPERYTGRATWTAVYDVIKTLATTSS